MGIDDLGAMAQGEHPENYRGFEGVDEAGGIAGMGCGSPATTERLAEQGVVGKSAVAVVGVVVGLEGERGEGVVVFVDYGKVALGGYAGADCLEKRHGFGMGDAGRRNAAMGWAGCDGLRREA